MSMIQKKRRNRRKSNSLKGLTHEQVSAAMTDYLANGGKITRIESTERSLEEFLACGGNSGLSDADEYLNGAS